MVLRVKKEDSAYLYQILESYEGLTSFSTLFESKSIPYRDVILHIAPNSRKEVERLVMALKEEIALEVLPSKT